MTARDRKNSLKALFGDPAPVAPETKSALTAVNTKTGEADSAAPVDANGTPPRAASGAIKAMGLSLSNITRQAEEARALRQALEDGERVIALETASVDSSFVSDRLSEGERDDPDFLALVDSIRESGQHAPILVRPSPTDQNRYQIAYGHRRLRAAQLLGQPVKAIVRALSDDELVLAQGKENAERRNLSFIERALFAKTLVDHGFDRKIAGDALAVQKSELSRLLQVAEAVPDQFIRAVGPAPKAGRDRWMALGQLFVNDAAKIKAADEIGSEHFRAATSDERFRFLFDRLARRPEKPVDEDIKGPDGRSFARIRRSGKGLKIELAADLDPGFTDTLAMRLAQDYARFVSGKD